MTGFSLPENYTSNPEALLRQKKRSRASSSAAPPPTDEPPVTPAPVTTFLMAGKTLREFSVPSVANVPTGPAVKPADKSFELRSGLITMVQASPFCGLPSEDANAHLQSFLEI